MFRISATVGGVVKALDIFSDKLSDLDGLLKDFGRLKRLEVSHRFRSGGPGWEPKKASTLAKQDSAKARSQQSVVAHATRKMKRKLAREYKRAVSGGDLTTIARRLAVNEAFDQFAVTGKLELLPVTAEQKATAKARGRITRELRMANKSKNGDRVTYLKAKLDEFDHKHEGDLNVLADARLRRSIAKLPERTARALEKSGSGRLLGGLAGSIRAKISGGTLTLESRVPWAGVHNEGGKVGNGATVPARPFLEWTEADFDEFTAMAADRAMAAFEE